MVFGRSARAALAALAALTVVGAFGVTAAPAPAGATGSSRAVAGVTLGQVVGRRAPAGIGDLEAVACATTSRCWAVGAMPVSRQTASAGGATVVLARTTDGGGHWGAVRVHTNAPVELTAISCPVAHSCTSVGATSVNGIPVGAVLTTTNAGRTWVTRPAPTGSVDLVGVDCRSATDCMTLATDGTVYWAAVTTDGGRAWQREGTLPAGFGGPGGISCPRPGHCLVAGYTSVSSGKGAGAVAITGDGGATWQLATLTSGTGLLHAVACPSSTICLAAGTSSTIDTDLSPAPGALLVSSDGGATFSADSAPAGMDDGFGLACSTPARCVLVGTVWTAGHAPVPSGSVLVTDDAGRQWRRVASRFVPVGLVGVACPAPTACVAAGNDVVARIELPPPLAREGSTGTAAGTSGSASKSRHQQGR